MTFSPLFQACFFVSRACAIPWGRGVEEVMLKDKGGEETGSRHAVKEAEGEGEGMFKQPVCTGKKFKSVCTKLS